MATDRPCGADLVNAGGGLGLGIIQLSAIIPGFLPALALAAALLAVVVVPLIALGLLAALLAAPPYGLWRLAARHRQRRSEPRRAAAPSRAAARPSIVRRAQREAVTDRGGGPSGYE